MAVHGEGDMASSDADGDRACLEFINERTRA